MYIYIYTCTRCVRGFMCEFNCRDLRHSNVEADMKLAQTIKDQFLSRVRIATQVREVNSTASTRLSTCLAVSCILYVVM